MKLLLAVAASLAVASASLAPVVSFVPEHTIIQDQYIVVFKEGDHHNFDAFKNWQQSPQALALGIDVMYWYSIGDFLGFAARFDADQLEAVRVFEGIDYIERDSEVSIVENPQQNPTWGVDRVDQEALPLDKLYYFNEGAGKDIDVYVVDTGVFTTHENFDGKARFGACFPSNSRDCQSDCHGHGTHVAGSVMSREYGVSRAATIIGVKVLSCSGSGSFADVIAGIDYTAEAHQRSGKKLSVSNMSLGGGRNTAVNSAVDNAHNAGVITVVAAGNDGRNACNLSPASADKAFTVGATGSSDTLASFSSRGPCVDILAPGVSITSLANSNSGTRTMSGTSMAAPHVAGEVANYLTTGNPSSADEAVESVIARGAENKITGVPSDTANILLQTLPSNKP